MIDPAACSYCMYLRVVDIAPVIRVSMMVPLNISLLLLACWLLVFAIRRSEEAGRGSSKKRRVTLTNPIEVERMSMNCPRNLIWE
eukprot:scaffold235389_cov56-Cyclotella_meneghiniana.AAC.1